MALLGAKGSLSKEVRSEAYLKAQKEAVIQRAFQMIETKHMQRPWGRSVLLYLLVRQKANMAKANRPRRVQR